MAFNERHWAKRFEQMGDEAEGIFESVYPQGFVKTGLCRPPILMSALPPMIRHMPDYLTSKGWVEVQGFGRDQLGKFKVDKLASLHEWHQTFRVDFFLWDSKNRRHGWLRLPDLQQAIAAEAGELRAYHDGPSYWAIPLDDLPVVEWVLHGDKLGVER